MEKLKTRLLAAIFQTTYGRLFFVEYQTDLDLERLTKEHGECGNRLVEATSVDDARDLIKQQDVLPIEDPVFRR